MSFWCRSSSVSGTTVEIDLNTPDIAPEKVNNGQDNSKRNLTNADKEAIKNKNGEEITYKGKKYSFSNTKKENINGSGQISILRTKGEIHLPDEVSGGSFCFDFITNDPVMQNLRPCFWQGRR